MSRTYRRKNSKSCVEERLANGTVVKVESKYYWIGYASWWLAYETEKDLIKEVRLYHTDKWDLGSVPSWFTYTYCTRPFRSENKRYIDKVYKLMDYEEIDSAPVFKRTSAYKYW